MDLAAQQLRFNTEPLGQPLAHQPHRQQHRLGHTQGRAHLVVILLRDGSNIPDRDAVGVGENITLPGLPLLRGGDHGAVQTAARRKDAGRVHQNDLGVALDGDAAHSLVRCTLHTGRTHQIRVHMASLGHPLIADTLYGGQPEGGLERQALHAFRLAFEHPVTKKPLVHYAPLPQDMAGALDLWGLRYNLPESL